MIENIIVAIISSGVLSTIITLIANKLSKKTDLEKAVMQIMGMLIRERCEKAIEKGGISLEGLRQIQDMNILITLWVGMAM